MTDTITTLSKDWVNFARASLATRITDTEKSTQRVLIAIQRIAEQLDNKPQLEDLLHIENRQAIPATVLPILKDVLKTLDADDELKQLIGPLYTALQFEDRTRQKLEGLLEIMTVWSETRLDDAISDEVLASKLMEPVVSPEQQAILATYFPDYIQVEDSSDELEFF